MYSSFSSKKNLITLQRVALDVVRCGAQCEQGDFEVHFPIRLEVMTNLIFIFKYI